MLSVYYALNMAYIHIQQTENITWRTAVMI